MTLLWNFVVTAWIWTCFFETEGLIIEYNASTNNREGHDPNPSLVNDGNTETCMLYNYTAVKEGKKQKAVLNLKMKSEQKVTNIVIKNPNYDDVSWVEGMKVMFRNTTSKKNTLCKKISRLFPKTGELTIACDEKTNQLRLVNTRKHIYICELEIHGPTKKRVGPVQRNTGGSPSVARTTLQPTVHPTTTMKQNDDVSTYSTEIIFSTDTALLDSKSKSMLTSSSKTLDMTPTVPYHISTSVASISHTTINATPQMTESELSTRVTSNSSMTINATPQMAEVATSVTSISSTTVNATPQVSESELSTSVNSISSTTVNATPQMSESESATSVISISSTTVNGTPQMSESESATSVISISSTTVNGTLQMSESATSVTSISSTTINTKPQKSESGFEVETNVLSSSLATIYSTPQISEISNTLYSTNYSPGKSNVTSEHSSSMSDALLDSTTIETTDLSINISSSFAFSDSVEMISNSSLEFPSSETMASHSSPVVTQTVSVSETSKFSMNASLPIASSLDTSQYNSLSSFLNGTVMSTVESLTPSYDSMSHETMSTTPPNTTTVAPYTTNMSITSPETDTLSLRTSMPLVTPSYTSDFVFTTSDFSQYSTLIETSFSDIVTISLSSLESVTISSNGSSQLATQKSSTELVSTTQEFSSMILISQTITTGMSSVYVPISSSMSSIITIPPPKPTTPTSGTQNNTGSKGSIVPTVASVVAVAVVGTSLAVFILIYRRRRKQKDDEEVRLNPIITPDVLPVMAIVQENTDINENIPLEKFIPSHVGMIDVDELHNIMNEMKANSSFNKDFKSFPSGMVLPHEEGSKEINKIKNRYINMISYDHSRVVLRGSSNDYINANFIDNFERQRAYIATQGPVEKTISDFWRMVWSENVGKIVMLTNLVEQHKVKCHQYWPSKEKKMKIGNLIVVLNKDEQYPIYNLRTFTLTDETTKTTKHVVQFHFTVWPDHGVPDCLHFLIFHDRVVNYPTQSVGPVVVHCSAGVGRTGTFIAFDALKSKGFRTGEVDIYMYVEYMRKCRVNMVQTLDQYMFIYRILSDFFIAPASMTDVEILKDDWFCHDTEAKNERINEEFEILGNLAPMYKDCDYSVALLEGNVKKNRNRSILAANNYRVEIDTGEKDGEYINAVFVTSMSGNDDYIVTEIPVYDMQEDFWKMVYDYESTVILMLDTPETPKESFLPENEEDILLFGSHEITCNSTENSSNVHKAYLTLTKEHDVENMEILCLTVPGSWESATSSVPPSKLLVSLYQEIKKWQEEQGNHIVTVVCRDGCTRCGLFCAVANIVDCVDIYGKVDILNTIRQIQTRRPQFIKNEEQYGYCIDSALEYTAVFEHTYMNV